MRTSADIEDGSLSICTIISLFDPHVCDVPDQPNYGLLLNHDFSSHPISHPVLNSIRQVNRPKFLL